jgi:hypothetical protein
MFCTKISFGSFEDLKVTVRRNFWGLKIGSTVCSDEIYNCFVSFLILKGKQHQRDGKSVLASKEQLKFAR